MTESNMEGKICLVTGGSSGIGKVTARELARLGATVVMVCRNRAKGEAAQQEIQAATGSAKVDLLIADLASLADVRRVAGDFTQKYTQLHILIHNAGGANNERKLTPDGYETTFVANYLAPFLLTELLLDMLKASAPARIVNVSSAAHTRGKINFSDLQGEKSYGTWMAYSQAKLALIIYTYELARQLQGSGVTVNALHPGVIASNFDQGLSPFMRWGWKLIMPLLSSVEQGAQTTLYLATSPEVEGVSGKYFSNRKETRSSNISYDEATRQRLWQVSEELVHLA
ncbi:MAG TPA: SDR family oxidoreductase [Ktedonobacteraceae bacterium]|nr:SDR family oxidoreductase [Ktedonobacteraceae bacterium]